MFEKILYCELGELSAEIETPNIETSDIIPLVAKQAITMKQFLDMFFNGPYKRNQNVGTMKIKKQNYIIPPMNKDFEIAEFETSAWYPHGKTDWENITIGQYYDYSKLGGFNVEKQIFSTNSPRNFYWLRINGTILKDLKFSRFIHRIR